KRLLAIPLGRRPSKWKAEDYVGGGNSKLIYLNLKIPQVRAAFKKEFSFSKLALKDQWRVWDYIWLNSKYFEVMLGATYFANTRSIEEILDNRDLVLKWVERVDNWAHSDELSSIYSRLLEFNP